jgi:hypothetical protein
VIDNDEIIDPWLGQRAAQAQIERGLPTGVGRHIAGDNNRRDSRLKCSGRRSFA